MGNAKALFLIDHQKPQLMKMNVLAQKLVGADHDIGLAGFKPPYNLFLRCAGHKPRQHSDRDGIVHHALLKVMVVLRCQNGGRYQVRHLISAHDRLKGRTHRNLGLSISHITAQKPIHGMRLFHIRLDLFNAAQLIVRLLIKKGRLKITLPLAVLCKCNTGNLTALGIKRDQFFCHVLGRRLDALLGIAPLGAAQLVDLDPGSLGRRMLKHHVKLVGGYVQNIAAPILNL